MGPAAQGDEALLEKCLRGEPGAWDEFLRRFSKLIYWSIRQTMEDSRFSAREDLVADIFQDIFGKIFEKNALSGLRDAQHLKKFLVVMSAHETMDKLRGLSRADEKTVFIDAGAPDIQASLQNSPDTSADRHEKNAVISEVLDSLGAKERACIEFHIFDGKTHREIGLILGFSQETVSTIIRRTKDKLRKKFIKKGF